MDSELRKRFNPDGSLLRRQQLRMLELLEVIGDLSQAPNTLLAQFRNSNRCSTSQRFHSLG